MINVKVNVEDYEGNVTEEEVTFHLHDTEILKLKAYRDLTDIKKPKELTDKLDITDMYELVESLIDSAYGIRDGNRFRKSADILQDFKDSPAYDAVLQKFLEPDFVEVFMLGVISKSASSAISAKYKEELKEYRKQHGLEAV